MRHLQTYRIFESSGSGLTPDQEKFLRDNSSGIGKSYEPAPWTYDPRSGLVDLDGNFELRRNADHEDLMGIRFGRVSGYFSIAGNRFTSLEGAPREVGGNFFCDDNELISLVGGPERVGKMYSCSGNRLTSLEGAPRELESRFVCNSNGLSTLFGAPRRVGSFSCNHNNLTTLEGGPREVDRDFSCNFANLVSLEGAPERVGGNFHCLHNHLTDLQGAPREVGGRFYCEENPLVSLQGAPEHIKDGFESSDLEIDARDWNPQGWLKVLRRDNQKAKRLILSILPVELLNREIRSNPAGMVMSLRSIWHDPDFAQTRTQLQWPAGYEGKMQRAAGLDRLGL